MPRAGCGGLGFRVLGSGLGSSPKPQNACKGISSAEDPQPQTLKPKAQSTSKFSIPNAIKNTGLCTLLACLEQTGQKVQVHGQGNVSHGTGAKATGSMQYAAAARMLCAATSPRGMRHGRRSSSSCRRSWLPKSLSRGTRKSLGSPEECLNARVQGPRN